jgi:aerotaxis receptor
LGNDNISVEKEIFLDTNICLISKTDENGIISFVNDEFCNITGYDMDEIIGKTHNILRHQDMPSSVFNELWQTLKIGDMWTGFIKNKTKSGDFFWVYATIYPCTNHFGIKEYIAYRGKALEFEIEQIKILHNSDFYK